jgi:proteic killer suppression protein
LILSFGDKETRELYRTGKSKKLPPDIWRRSLRKLEMIDKAETLDDLKVPPGNRLEALKGDRAGYYSIRINDQWRITFKFKNGNALEVKIEDYHK